MAPGPSSRRTPDRLREAVDAYLVDHEAICLVPNARNRRHTYVLSPEDESHSIVQQALVDPEEHCDWIAEFDLAQSRAQGEPSLRLRKIGAGGQMRLV